MYQKGVCVNMVYMILEKSKIPHFHKGALQRQIYQSHVFGHEWCTVLYLGCKQQPCQISSFYRAGKTLSSHNIDSTKRKIQNQSND